MLLKPIAPALPEPGPSDWLANHKEKGETFEHYIADKPVRRDATRKRIAICLLGEFSAEQKKVLDITLEYMQVFYCMPVDVIEELPVGRIPAEAQRTRGYLDDQRQILSTHILNKVLKPNVPGDAVAYLCFTAEDLYPEESWNFVYGQASLRDRTGVWSMHRNGNPAKGKKEFQLCLERTMKTASHETGHILGLVHCIAHSCNMNGSNHMEEADRQPAQFCPECLRKLCWNLQVDPVEYLQSLEKFSEKHSFTADTKIYKQWREVLEKERSR